MEQGRAPLLPWTPELPETEETPGGQERPLRTGPDVSSKMKPPRQPQSPGDGSTRGRAPSGPDFGWALPIRQLCRFSRRADATRTLPEQCSGSFRGLEEGWRWCCHTSVYARRVFMSYSRDAPGFVNREHSNKTSRLRPELVVSGCSYFSRIYFTRVLRLLFAFH